MNTALRQTTALFADAYRELAAGKLFWITLVLSATVAGVFAAVGIDEEGMTVLWFRLPIPVDSSDISPGALYKLLFFQLGISVWLAWIATILGLITTAGIIPSLVSSGVIDSMVAKPITRTRLFLTRYATGLLFAALQVGLFSGVAFLVLGVRGGEWLPAVFLAVPIVVVFFSYLFAIMALVGLITRSTITALLLTLLVWFGLFIVNRVDESLIQFHERAKIRIQTADERIERGEANAKQIVLRAKQAEDPGVPDDYEPTREELDSAIPTLILVRQTREDAVRNEAELRPWTNGLFIAKTVLPKTTETIALLDRYILSEDEANEIFDIFTPGDGQSTVDEETGAVRVSGDDAQQALVDRIRSRSLAWILGTSLLFESAILGICCLIFTRRDF
ncbi:MAG: hypothetical protein AAGJ54_03520 [Planctomycetota bacterium]